MPPYRRSARLPGARRPPGQGARSSHRAGRGGVGGARRAPGGRRRGGDGPDPGAPRPPGRLCRAAGRRRRLGSAGGGRRTAARSHGAVPLRPLAGPAAERQRQAGPLPSRGAGGRGAGGRSSTAQRRGAAARGPLGGGPGGRAGEPGGRLPRAGWPLPARHPPRVAAARTAGRRALPRTSLSPPGAGRHGPGARAGRTPATAAVGARRTERSAAAELLAGTRLVPAAARSPEPRLQLPVHLPLRRPDSPGAPGRRPALRGGAPRGVADHRGGGRGTAGTADPSALPGAGAGGRPRSARRRAGSGRAAAPDRGSDPPALPHRPPAPVAPRAVPGRRRGRRAPGRTPLRPRRMVPRRRPR